MYWTCFKLNLDDVFRSCIIIGAGKMLYDKVTGKLLPHAQTFLSVIP